MNNIRKTWVFKTLVFIEWLCKYFIKIQIIWNSDVFTKLKKERKNEYVKIVKIILFNISIKTIDKYRFPVLIFIKLILYCYNIINQFYKIFVKYICCDYHFIYYLLIWIMYSNTEYSKLFSFRISNMALKSKILYSIFLKYLQNSYIS